MFRGSHHGAAHDFGRSATPALACPADRITGRCDRGRTMSDSRAPHPDDESLGCGGLIAACCAGARPPLVVVLTDGSGSHRGSRLFPPAKLISVREAEVTEAVRILGLPVERLMFLREQDTKAPHAGSAFDAVVRRLADFVPAFGCTTIVAPWCFDPHCDHEAAAKIACETARVTGIRRLAYPIWGWTLADDTPIEETAVRGWRLEIAPYLTAKRRAIRYTCLAIWSGHHRRSGGV